MQTAKETPHVSNEKENSLVHFDVSHGDGYLRLPGNHVTYFITD